jgi:hypothetical protein
MAFSILIRWRLEIPRLAQPRISAGVRNGHGGSESRR